MRPSVENIGKTVLQHWLLIGPAMLLALSACQTVQTTQSGVVGVQRQQAMLVSAEQVNQDAQKAYRQVLGEAQKKKTLNADAAVLARVRAIAARLTPATVAFRSDAPGWAENSLRRLIDQCHYCQGRQRLVHAWRQDRGLHRPDRAPECHG